jgi:hypothetical protein
VFADNFNQPASHKVKNHDACQRDFELEEKLSSYANLNTTAADRVCHFNNLQPSI